MATARKTPTAARRAAPAAPKESTPERVSAKVVQAFSGMREDDRVFMVGETFEGTPERVAELRRGGFLEAE